MDISLTNYIDEYDSATENLREQIIGFDYNERLKRFSNIIEFVETIEENQESNLVLYNSYYDRGYCNYFLGKSKEALKDFEHVCKLLLPQLSTLTNKPREILYICMGNAASIYGDYKNYNKQSKYYNKIIKDLSATNASLTAKLKEVLYTCYYNYALDYEQSDNNDKATKYYRIVIDELKGDTDLSDDLLHNYYSSLGNLAYLNYKGENNAAALVKLEEIINHLPKIKKNLTVTLNKILYNSFYLKALVNSSMGNHGDALENMGKSF